MRRPPVALQLLGSVLVALAIVAVAIAVVTAHFGPTAAAELEAREDIAKERTERLEEAREEREEAREERLGQ
jgi:ribosomal protein L12E/L44/L45/RPP1/RPP2